MHMHCNFPIHSFATSFIKLLNNLLDYLSFDKKTSQKTALKKNFDKKTIRLQPFAGLCEFKKNLLYER